MSAASTNGETRDEFYLFDTTKKNCVKQLFCDYGAITLYMHRVK